MVCFFAFGKSLGFFTWAVVSFPFCLCGLSFLERSLTRLCMYRCSFSRSGSLSSSRDTRVLIRFRNRLLGNHWLNWWHRWRLWRLCARMYSIWTVAVVLHLVVNDRHRHSLELVSIGASVIEIVVVIAYAVHFRLLLFLSHQQVDELEAILVAVQVNLAVQEAQEAPEVSSRSSKKVNLGGDGELVSFPPSLSGVISRS